MKTEKIARHLADSIDRANHDARAVHSIDLIPGVVVVRTMTMIAGAGLCTRATLIPVSLAEVDREADEDETLLYLTASIRFAYVRFHTFLQ
jgi:hypothetical protein